MAGNPRDDLISDLVTAELDGEKLDDEENYSFLPMLLPAGIEEGLRYESPILLTPRVAITATELAGVSIPEGAVVTAMVASANRDPDAYEHPGTFDIFRDAHQHMSFGTGPHLCLGMHLARLETRVALNTLLDRLPSLRLDHDAVRSWTLISKVTASFAIRPACRLAGIDRARSGDPSGAVV